MCPTAITRARSAQAGNTVKIASIGDVTIGDYTKDTRYRDPESLTDDEQTLLIDQAKYFNFYVDSDRPGPAERERARRGDAAIRLGLREAADTFLAGVMDAAVPAGNKIGSTATPEVPTKDDAYEYLVDLGVLLDEANVPIDGRFVVVPAWFHGLLLKDDRFISCRHVPADRGTGERPGRRGGGFRDPQIEQRPEHHRREIQDRRRPRDRDRLRRAGRRRADLQAGKAFRRCRQRPARLRSEGRASDGPRNADRE